MNFFKVLTLYISLFLFSNYSFSQCFEIESILVDACDNTTDEAYNEMFRMRIGGAALNTSSLNVNWPAQTWLGLVQNAATAAKVSQLNAAIVAAGGCGQILEPTGGVLPANSTVIVVTSPNLDTTLNSFGALTSSIYMLFQNTPAAPNAGHFGNYNATPATRTLAVTFGGGCSDSVTYQRANLVNIFGAVGGSISDLNGSTVNFTASGTASYVNNGCTAPIPPFTVEAGTTPITGCPGQIINLTGTAQGQTSVTWTAASGSFSNPNNLTTSYTIPLSATSGSSITLTLSVTNSCSATITDNIIINVGGPSLTLASGSNSQSVCLGASISAITYTFGSGATGVNVSGLPAGVTSIVSGNNVVISGAPTTTTGSPFNYSITTTGGSCGNVTTNGTITVSNNGSLNLFCDTGNSTPTSLAFDFSNVGQSSFTYSYTIDGGTPITGTHISPSNFTVTGLTPGQTVIFTLTANGVSCVPSQTVNCSTSCPTPTLTLTSATGTNTQSTCINTNITPITYTFGNGATGVTVTGLPTGVNFTTSGNNVTITGTPSTTIGSPFSYTITTIGGSCGTGTLGGTIMVNSNPTLVLNSTTATTNQSVCVNTSINPISYTFGGSATGINVTGLPTGVSSIVSGNTVTISGTPTTTTGSPFNYTISTSGGSCGTISLNGTITVNPAATLVLTSAISTTNQIVCTNTTIIPITYTFGNGATGVTVTGLPTGVNFTTSGNNNVTITGTPSTTTGSPFSFTITTIGGSCGTATLGGTITVNSNPTLVLNSTTATTNQSVCVNTSINPISYTFGGGATGVNVTGLPSGVSSIVSGNTVTISGSPTTTTGSPFNYTISTSGGSCGTISLNGTLTVNPAVSLALTSAISTTNQIVCANTTIVPINYTIGNGATGYTITGLPAGVSHTISGNFITISGIPTGIIGTPYTYTITTNGGCGSQNSSGVLTLTNGTVPVFTQVLPICAGTTTTSPLPTTSNNGIIGTWSPTFNNSATNTYTFTPNSGQCALNTQMTIQITPSPTITNIAFSSNICSGSSTDIVLTSDVLNTTYTWSATISNITGSYITSGNETNINQIATLTDSENIGTITMVIIPRANGCDGTPQTVIITVNPNPVVEVVAVADTSVCSATSATNNVQVNISGNISGITYNWTAITSGVTVVGGTTSGTITATSTTASFGLQVITSNPLVAGTISFEVSAVRNGCIGNTLQSAVVTVNPNPGVAISSPDKTICSGDPTNLMIDVSPLIAGTEIEWEVLTVVNVSGANPGSGIAPQPINDILTSTTGGYVIYRVRTSLGDCEGSYTDYRVNVNPAPQPILADGNICITATGDVYQTYTLNTGLNNADYDFEWFDSNGNIIPGETNATLVVDEAGTYSVIATNWLTGCSSDSTLSTATATVTETMPATTMTVVQSEYFSDNATITVNVTGGTGTLMYSLDEGPLQSSNVFTGVSPGVHLVTVIDTEGCTYLTQEVTIIDYPNYFTPNGDGYNDSWYIAGLQDTDFIYIFDRYGKLIKQLRGEERWDGTYNQEQLPSTDYWFTLDYTENGAVKQFKAHFSLKR